MKKVIYKCDKCGNEFKDKKVQDIEIRIYEKFDININQRKYTSHSAEVCDKCLIELGFKKNTASIIESSWLNFKNEFWEILHKLGTWKRG